MYKPKQSSTKYCSRHCQAKDLGQRYGKANGEKRRTGFTLCCPICSKEFYVMKYRALTAKFCSRRCLALGHPELGEKARAKSPITNRPKATAPRKYISVSINGKQVREHRYVMEQHLGRKLTRNEHVHHINGDPLDNRIENLQVLTNAEHQKLELSAYQ